ncbi:hypothetical protein COU59_00170 [Candidatus Pacearchaeota archaeon CG10_big_fil_rev_8_21_14_0_10_34_12]|nr:MAG: hypothetical protein COU59_00170 [Candidatus Pacearchaeota archaeon CG10_big_fil_rev_8_21_14_0_10_34_12]
MQDIFEHAVLCMKCDKKMEDSFISRNGFNLRIKKCAHCGDFIVHPDDKAEYENFVRLKKKEYEVKMRMVGNSYAISIPREIVDFMKEQENMINNMVRLSFQDFGKLNLMFNTGNGENGDDGNLNSRIVKSKEVRIIKNNEPVLHAKQFTDSAYPERNKTEIVKNIKKLKK